MKEELSNNSSGMPTGLERQLNLLEKKVIKALVYKTIEPDLEVAGLRHYSSYLNTTRRQRKILSVVIGIAIHILLPAALIMVSFTYLSYELLSNMLTLALRS